VEPTPQGDSHAHPDEEQLQQMKATADRTRQDAAARLADFDERQRKTQLNAKMAMWGIAAVTGAVVVALLMREEPRRRIAAGVRRAADRFAVRERSEDVLERIQEFLHDAIGPRR